MNKPSKIVGMNGFSLIELMIGITLGLLIMTALVTLFVNTSRTNTEMAKVNSQIENGRFAMQLLENEIIHGGFWGGFVPQFEDLTATGAPGDVPSTNLVINPSYDATDDPLLVPCKAQASWGTTYVKFLLGIPVQAYDDVPTGCSAVVTNKKANTDVLLVRHAATCLPGVDNCEDIEEDKFYFQFSQCENEIGAATPLLYQLAQAADDTASNFTLKKRGCTGTPPAATTGTVADIRKFISHIYYIRDFAVTAGDGIPSLMRAEFDENGGTVAHQSAQPLINGIEGFRVELGIDQISDDGATNIITGATPPYTEEIAWADPDNLDSPTNRGDGSPDVFVRCPLNDVAVDVTPPSTHPAATVCTAAQLANMVAVKIYVLARADVATPGYTDTKVYTLGTTTLGPFNDNFKRHVFSTTVRLNNVSGIRETP